MVQLKGKSLILVVALVLGACAGSADELLGAMQLQQTSEGGVVTVARGDESFQIDEDFDLKPGDVVSTSEDATAMLRLGGEGQTVSLGGATEVGVVGEGRVEARSGSILVAAGRPTEVAFGDAEAIADTGLFRLDRTSTTTRIGTYSGAVSINSPGQRAGTVERLFQVSVAAGDVSTPRPYQLEPSDPWDREHLGDVAELDRELNRLAAGFSNQIKRSGAGLRFVRAATGRERVGFVRPFLDRPPADVLTGFAIAEKTDRPLERAFLYSLRLRDQDGSWGVIAAIQQVKPRALVAEIEGMFEGSGALAEALGGSTGDGEGAPAGDGTTPGGGDGPDGNDGPGNDGPGDDDPGPTPTPSPTPTECEGSVAECTLNDILPEIPGLPL